jgi:hypothetical protein
MLCAALAVCCAGETTADLGPPFHTDDKGRIGYWELGGSATRFEDCVNLVPPIQYKRGAVWTATELPGGAFSIDYAFRVSEGTSGGNLGFWFVDRYGADGDLGGGPSVFRGIGVVMTVRRTTRGSQPSLGWHLIQHRERAAVDREAELVQPGVVVPWSRAPSARLTVAFGAGRGLRVTLACGGAETVLFDTAVTADLAGAYIGVTAQSDVFTSRFDLEAVRFTLPAQSRAREGVGFGDEPPRSHYLPDAEGALRNPVFAKTARVLLAQLNGTGAFTQSPVGSRDVLDVIGELTRASNGVASYGELNDWVRLTLVPYTQKWHRRTAKIVDGIREARNVMGAAWNYTESIVAALNGSVLANAERAAFKLADLGGRFQAEAGQLAQTTGAQRGSASARAFVAFAILEVAFVAFFFILMQRRDWRMAIFGG